MGGSAEPSRVDRPATTTTSQPQRYSFDDSVTPPGIQNTGTNFIAITQSLLRYGARLDADNPDPGLVSHIAAPGSKVERGVRRDLATLKRLKRRLYEIESGPSKFEIIDERDDAVTVRQVQRLVRQQVVDPTEHVTSERNFASPTTTYTILLTRSTDGHWLLADVEESS